MRFLCLIFLVTVAFGQEVPLTHAPGMSFHDYIEKTKTMIRDRRQAAGVDASDETVSMNAPFEVRGKGRNEICVLMTHGYLASPYEMQDMARLFADRGYRVRAVLLPGHGTVRDDLLGVGNDAWKGVVAYGIDTFIQDGCKKIILFGQSTGGGLSIAVSQKRVDVDALVLISPLVQLEQKARLSKVVNLFGPKWFQNSPEKNPIRYDSVAWEDVEDLWDLGQEIKAGGSKTNLPLFVAQSKDDTYLHYPYAIDFYKSSTNSLKDLFLYDRTLLRPEDKGILSFSHVGLHISPDNVMWGRQGRLKACIHYANQPEKLKKCERGQGVYAEISDEFLKENEVVVLISFNPRFDLLTARVNQFLDQLETHWKKSD